MKPEGEEGGGTLSSSGLHDQLEGRAAEVGPLQYVTSMSDRWGSIQD